MAYGVNRRTNEIGVRIDDQLDRELAEMANHDFAVNAAQERG
jgi:hypothetical protein